MALTANRELNRYVDQELRSFSVAAAAHVYKGAFVGFERSTGHVRNLQSGDLFAGIAYEEIDNSGGAAGAQSVRLYTQGDFILTTSGATQALAGAPVYASDNETTTVSPNQGMSFVGIVMAVVGSNLGVVRIMPVTAPQQEQAVYAPLTSSTSAATTHTVMVPQRAIRVVSAQVSFRVVPDQGLLDVGIVVADPDEMVDAFNLTTLSVNTPALLPLASRSFAAAAPIYAKVGQATSTAGLGGMLALRYVELP
ncbi:MAG TPA: hypothetical protein VNT79_13115 [Phycisphaerae bacterium]|nr:hypothetical protein [Phycisphaerae bacterium]